MLRIITQAAIIDPATNRQVEISDSARAEAERDLGYRLDIDFNFIPDAPMNEIDHVQGIVCPNCQFVEYVPNVSIRKPTRGYAHKDFYIECRECTLPISRESLSVARFAINLLLYFKENFYLSGTRYAFPPSQRFLGRVTRLRHGYISLHPQTGRPDGLFAATLNSGLTSTLRRLCDGCHTVGEIGARLHWKWANVEKYLRTSELGIVLQQRYAFSIILILLVLTRRRVTKILRSYSQPQFSVDLVSA